MQPAEDDVELLLGERLLVRGLVAQRRKYEAFDGGQDLSPQLLADERPRWQFEPRQPLSHARERRGLAVRAQAFCENRKLIVEVVDERLERCDRLELDRKSVV